MLQIFSYYNLIISILLPPENIRHGYYYREDFYASYVGDFIKNRIFDGVSMDIFRYNSNDQIESSMMNIQGTIEQNGEDIKTLFFIGTDLKLSLFGFQGKGFPDSYYLTRFRLRSVDRRYPDTYFCGFLYYDGHFRQNLLFTRDRCTIQEERWISKYGFTFFKKYYELSPDDIRKKIEDKKKMRKFEHDTRLDNLSDFLRNDTTNKEELLKCEEEVFEKGCSNILLESHIYRLVRAVLHDEQSSESQTRHSGSSHYLSNNEELANKLRQDSFSHISVLNLLYYYSNVIDSDIDYEDDPAYSIIPMYGRLKSICDTIPIRKIVYIDASRYYKFYKDGIEYLSFKFLVDKHEEFPAPQSEILKADCFKTMYYAILSELKHQVTDISVYFEDKNPKEPYIDFCFLS